MSLKLSVGRPYLSLMTRSVDLDVLVVDPSAATRAQFVEALTAAGYSAHARNTSVGVTYTLLVRPAKLVILDLDLPFGHAERAVRMIRAERNLARTKIALASDDPAKLIAAVRATGADAGIVKREGGALLAIACTLIGAPVAYSQAV